MYRLIRLMLVLIAIHVALVAVSRLPTSNEHPAFLDLFTNPDGTPCERPCLFGVRPGKVSIEEAARIVQKHWLLDDLRIIPTENYEFPLIANAKGVWAGKRFRIWLVPGPGDQVPIMTTGVAFGIVEYEDAL